MGDTYKDNAKMGQPGKKKPKKKNRIKYDASGFLGAITSPNSGLGKARKGILNKKRASHTDYY